MKNYREEQPEWYYYPEALELYKKYLRVMLKDRGHLIDAIEPQNEIWRDGNVPGQMNLLRATREVVDEVAPHILVVCPNAPPGSYGSPWATLCKEAGAGKLTDVVAGHFYCGRGNSALGSETVMEQWCLSLRALFTTEDGRSKPVWNTEWSTDYPTPFMDHPHHLAIVYSPGDPDLWLTPQMYAVVNVRQFIVMAVHDIKSFWHVYYPGSALTRRLHEYDSTPNPAGVAFSAATFILDGANFVARWQPCPDIRGYVVDTPRGAVAVFFGRRFLESEKASLEFTEGIPDAVVRDTMGNSIGSIKPGLTLMIKNDPIYITAPSMKGSALLGHLDKAVVTPPVRGSVVAKFLFDQTGEARAAQVTDTTGTYLMRPNDPQADVAPIIVKDAVDQGPSAGTFTYPQNRALYFPENCKVMMMMSEHDRLSRVFDATADPGMAVTVEAWVKIGAAPKAAGVIFEKNRWRHAPQYRLWFDREGRARWTHSWGGGNQTYLRLAGPKLTPGKWTHLAGMTEYDGKTMRCRLFVNGKLAEDARAVRRPVEAAFTKVIIGGDDESNPDILSNVSIDEITVHRKALDPEELAWFAGSRNPDLARALSAGMKRADAEDWAGFLPIDLSAVANRPLRDPQGSNDLRNLPPGDWIMASVPMRIIDPGANNQKAIVVLKGEHAPDLPRRVTVSVSPLRIEKLHFLHSVRHGGGSVAPLVTYTVTHQDGKQSVITCRGMSEIADWWYMGSLKNAKVAWTGSNPMTSKVRQYLYTWQNPDPTNAVKAIELVSGTGGPTPVIVAMTALCMP
ncbi:MAG: LamG domain-containing protein [Lentisphaeria bacterium]|nr:LamG domain-containing protein [Lentisphaeria bacterium]